MRPCLVVVVLERFKLSFEIGTCGVRLRNSRRIFLPLTVNGTDPKEGRRRMQCTEKGYIISVRQFSGPTLRKSGDIAFLARWRTVTQRNSRDSLNNVWPSMISLAGQRRISSTRVICLSIGTIDSFSQRPQRSSDRPGTVSTAKKSSPGLTATDPATGRQPKSYRAAP